MKYLLAFGCLAVLASACSSSPSLTPAQQKVEAYLKKTLDDPASYQPAHWGKETPITRADSLNYIAMGRFASSDEDTRDSGIALVAQAKKDTVTVAGATGEVVEINPRRTVIRDDAGNVHTIPNSAITVAVNRTASLRRFQVSFEVAFPDSEAAAAIVNQVSKQISPEHRAMVAGPPQLVAQTAVGDGVRLTIVGEALPADRWLVEADLRRRLQRAFESERVEMKFASPDAEQPPGSPATP